MSRIPAPQHELSQPSCSPLFPVQYTRYDEQEKQETTRLPEQHHACQVKSYLHTKRGDYMPGYEVRARREGVSICITAIAGLITAAASSRVMCGICFHPLCRM